ncbi:hypothetical protein ABLE91_26765 [Aquabacter sp. CN5-332]|uniref:hypothetical protein n=1 Tax=Aquabacter sp. CN5-332 TaxID=3156608 RepID=UPI0032B4C69D
MHETLLFTAGKKSMRLTMRFDIWRLQLHCEEVMGNEVDLDLDNSDVDVDRESTNARLAVKYLHEEQFEFPEAAVWDASNNLVLNAIEFSVRQDLIDNACRAIFFGTAESRGLSIEKTSEIADIEEDKAAWCLHIRSDRVQIFNIVKGFSLSATIPLIEAVAVPPSGVIISLAGYQLNELVKHSSSGATVEFEIDLQKSAMTLTQKESHFRIKIARLNVQLDAGVDGPVHAWPFRTAARAIDRVRPFASRNRARPISGVIELRGGVAFAASEGSFARYQSPLLEDLELRVRFEHAKRLCAFFRRMHGWAASIVHSGDNITVKNSILSCTFDVPKEKFANAHINPDLDKCFRSSVDFLRMSSFSNLLNAKSTGDTFAWVGLEERGSEGSLLFYRQSVPEMEISLPCTFVSDIEAGTEPAKDASPLISILTKSLVKGINASRGEDLLIGIVPMQRMTIESSDGDGNCLVSLSHYKALKPASLRSMEPHKEDEATFST